MSDKIETLDAGKRVFKLITGEVIFGSVETVPTEQGAQILVKKPFEAKGGNMMPYMTDVMGSSPAAVQIHPMNIIWTVPLDEFEEAYRVYQEATSGIVTEKKQQIVV